MINAAYYSIRRRFLNKNACILSGIILLISCCLFFFDIFAKNILKEDGYLVKVTTDSLQVDILKLNPILKYDPKASISIKTTDRGYRVDSDQVLNSKDKEVITQGVAIYHKMLYPNLDYDLKIVDKLKGTANHYSYIMTFLYFFMMNFSAMMVQEVIAEKENHLLEYLSTIIKPNYLFIGKVCIGVVSVLIQLLIYVIFFLLLLSLRQCYDEGKGLLKMLYQWGLLNKEYANFKVFFSQNRVSVKYLFCIFFYMIASLYWIQMFMLASTVSSQSIEEASMIQGPFYLCLLFLYYLCMALQVKNYACLKWMGLCPMLSSLLAPYLIITGTWHFWEIILSFSSQILFLFISRKVFTRCYVKRMFMRK